MYLLFEKLLLCKFKFSFILRLQLFFFNDQMQAFTESCQCGVVLRPLITTIYYFNSRLKEKPFPTVSGIMVFCYQRTLFSVSVSINEAQQLSFLILVIFFLYTQLLSMYWKFDFFYCNTKLAIVFKDIPELFKFYLRTNFETEWLNIIQSVARLRTYIFFKYGYIVENTLWLIS